VSFEALEWVTSDRYITEIREMSLENWIRQYQNAQEWSRRNEMLRESLESSI
jgi:hypothetical protein